MVKKIFTACGGKEYVDTSTINPSRLSRFPGAFRKDRGTVQTLQYVGQRINNADLEYWLQSRGVMPPIPRAPRQVECPSGLSPYTRNFLMMGAQPGERNSSVFKAGCDFARNGFEVETALDMIVEAVDLSEEEIFTTLRSAYKVAGSQK